MSDPEPKARQRLDKWLWFARVAKTRTLAAKLVSEGFVRVNGVRSDVPHKLVSQNDVVTIALERAVRVLRVQDCGARRGPYDEARLLYDDLSPPPEAAVAPEMLQAVRDSGSGRPTKKQRRELSRFEQGN